jgi:hypothetical protein
MGREVPTSFPADQTGRQPFPHLFDRCALPLLALPRRSDAKLSVLHWDAARHELAHSSLHYFEGDASLRQGRTLFAQPPLALAGALPGDEPCCPADCLLACRLLSAGCTDPPGVLSCFGAASQRGQLLGSFAGTHTVFRPLVPAGIPPPVQPQTRWAAAPPC